MYGKWKKEEKLSVLYLSYIHQTWYNLLPSVLKFYNVAIHKIQFWRKLFGLSDFIAYSSSSDNIRPIVVEIRGKYGKRSMNWPHESLIKLQEKNCDIWNGMWMGQVWRSNRTAESDPKVFRNPNRWNNRKSSILKTESRKVTPNPKRRTITIKHPVLKEEFGKNKKL